MKVMMVEKTVEKLMKLVEMVMKMVEKTGCYFLAGVLSFSLVDSVII